MKPMTHTTPDLIMQAIVQFSDKIETEQEGTLAEIDAITSHFDRWLARFCQHPECRSRLLQIITNGLLQSQSQYQLLVGVRIVDRTEIRELNRQFRQIDKETNILSFPADSSFWEPESNERELGDLVVCAAVVAQEAQALGIRLQDHWAHLIIHGTLHLIGYDHQQSGDAEQMEELEIQILAALQIANPYGEAGAVDDNV